MVSTGWDITSEILSSSKGMPSAVSHTISRDRKSTRLNSSHTEIYTLSLHDALPIFLKIRFRHGEYWLGHHLRNFEFLEGYAISGKPYDIARSEEHTSELQSHRDLHSFPTRRSSDLPENSIQAW